MNAVSAGVGACAGSVLCVLCSVVGGVSEGMLLICSCSASHVPVNLSTS